MWARGQDVVRRARCGQEGEMGPGGRDGAPIRAMGGAMGRQGRNEDGFRAEHLDGHISRWARSAFLKARSAFLVSHPPQQQNEGAVRWRLGSGLTSSAPPRSTARLQRG